MRYDTSGDGVLSEEEMTDVFEQLCIPKDDWGPLEETTLRVKNTRYLKKPVW